MSTDKKYICVPALSINNFNIIVFVIGIAIVAILQFVGNKKEAKAIQ